MSVTWHYQKCEKKGAGFWKIGNYTLTVEYFNRSKRNLSLHRDMKITDKKNTTGGD
jgi:hypothetical protein